MEEALMMVKEKKPQNVECSDESMDYGQEPVQEYEHETEQGYKQEPDQEYKNLTQPIDEPVRNPPTMRSYPFSNRNQWVYNHDSGKYVNDIPHYWNQEGNEAYIRNRWSIPHRYYNRGYTVDKNRIDGLYNPNHLQSYSVGWNMNPQYRPYSISQRPRYNQLNSGYERKYPPYAWNEAQNRHNSSQHMEDKQEPEYL